MPKMAASAEVDKGAIDFAASRFNQSLSSRGVAHAWARNLLSPTAVLWTPRLELRIGSSMC